MRIGIITFQRSHNYGAVLQAYALMTTLKGMGHTVELINYWPEYRKNQYDLFHLDIRAIFRDGVFSFAKNTFKRMLTLLDRYKQHVKFNKFIKNELGVKGKSFKLGRDVPDRFDAVFCGSDQIWRYNFRHDDGFDEVYFAKYPLNRKVIRISYAASMGDEDLDENAKQEISKLLENFDFISVRESFLLDLVAPLTKKLPVQVVDPALLLSADEWKVMAGKVAPKKRYLLFYQLLINPDAVRLAKRVAKERNLEIIQIRGVYRNTNPFGIGDLRLSAGPLDFLSLIANADYIVTTSYHGVLFSIIFEKPFSALGFTGNSYRVKSLLKSLGLEHRLIEKEADSSTGNIDYTVVNLLAKEMVTSSVSFIAQISDEKVGVETGVIVKAK